MILDNYANYFHKKACRTARPQASDIAELWFEFLSLPELIAYIGCAEWSNKPSKAHGNTQTCVLPLP